MAGRASVARHPPRPATVPASSSRQAGRRDDAVAPHPFPRPQPGEPVVAGGLADAARLGDEVEHQRGRDLLLVAPRPDVLVEHEFGDMRGRERLHRRADAMAAALGPAGAEARRHRRADGPLGGGVARRVRGLSRVQGRGPLPCRRRQPPRGPRRAVGLLRPAQNPVDRRPGVGHARLEHDGAGARRGDQVGDRPGSAPRRHDDEPAVGGREGRDQPCRIGKMHGVGNPERRV